MDDQTGLFDREVDDEALEKALEDREEHRQKRSDVNHAFKSVDDRCKALIEELELEPGEIVRCGRFRVQLRRREPRSVAFETAGSEGVAISLLED